jgi:hypothetical protein
MRCGQLQGSNRIKHGIGHYSRHRPFPGPITDQNKKQEDNLLKPFQIRRLQFRPCLPLPRHLQEIQIPVTRLSLVVNLQVNHQLMDQVSSIVTELRTMHLLNPQSSIVV